MGICSSKTLSQKPQTLTLDQLCLPTISASTNEKVRFFNSPKLALYMRQHPNNCQEVLVTFIRKLAMNECIDECLEQIKELCKDKSEVLLRCYNEYTDIALKLMQKVLEYYQNYYLQYIQLCTDIPLVKQIISEQTLQLSLENVVIVNALLDKNLTEAEHWWTTQYFAERTKMVAQTYQKEDDLHLSEHLSQPQFKVDPKDQLVRPYLEFVMVMKVRLGMTIQLKQSMMKSLNGSTQITQNHLNHFYQNLKDGLALSVTDPMYQPISFDSSVEPLARPADLGPIDEEQECNSIKE